MKKCEEYYNELINKNQLPFLGVYNDGISGYSYFKDNPLIIHIRLD